MTAIARSRSSRTFPLRRRPGRSPRAIASDGRWKRPSRSSKSVWKARSADWAIRGRRCSRTPWRCSPSMCSSLLRAAMRAVHGKAKIEQSFSTHHMAEEIRAMWPGMTLLLTTVFWESRCRGKDDAAVAQPRTQAAGQVRGPRSIQESHPDHPPPPTQTQVIEVHTSHLHRAHPGKTEMTALKT